MYTQPFPQRNFCHKKGFLLVNLLTSSFNWLYQEADICGKKNFLQFTFTFLWKLFISNISAANTGQSKVNCHQSSAFDSPCLSCNDYHHDQWVFQIFFYYYFQEIPLNNIELVFLEFKHFHKTHGTSLFSSAHFFFFFTFFTKSFDLISNTFCLFV